MLYYMWYNIYNKTEIILFIGYFILCYIFYSAAQRGVEQTTQCNWKVPFIKA